MELKKDPLRGRGRPAASGARQRGRLLQAARELLTNPGHGEPALRQVALRAGVTPALAHYYFGNRDGLMAALLHERIAPGMEDLLAATRVRAARPVLALTWLMQRLTSLMAGDRFLARCLLSQAAQGLRQQLRGLLRELLERAQLQGTLRADLSPAYLADTLLGMCMFPYLDEGSAGSSMGDQAAALTLQHVALLQDGIVRTHSPRQEVAS